MDVSGYGSTAAADPRALYLDLLKRAVMNVLYRDPRLEGDGGRYEVRPFDLALRLAGHDTPSQAHAFGGTAKFDNLQDCIETLLRDEIPGDLMEAGIWRGGATIFMRGALRAYGDATRVVWCADSFDGEPVPDPQTYPADAGNEFYLETVLRAGFDEVRENFAAYGLLDDRVRFLRGWFRDTLPSAPIERLALLRLDGDIYESTWIGLEHLYPKLSPGGFLIIDDYNIWPMCRQAVDEYRDRHGITEPIVSIDDNGAFWRRARFGNIKS